MTIANITMNRIKMTAKGFMTRTMNLLSLGHFFWIKYPIARGIRRPKAPAEILLYGTFILAEWKIVLPNVKSQNGIIPGNKNF